MLKSRIATVVGAIAAATMLTVTTAHATDGDELATATTISSGGPWSCAVSSGSASACFTANGDWFEISDLKADGHSAVATWELVRPSDGRIVRWGHIWNTSGVYTTRYKNKDFTEGYIVYWHACVGEWGTKDVIESTCSGPVNRTA